MELACTKRILKVKKSLYGPITGPEGSRRLNGFQPYTPAAFTHPEIFLVPISVRGSVDLRTTVR